jgi:succinoglycan biosynthesis transport protein ExoP
MTVDPSSVLERRSFLVLVRRRRFLIAAVTVVALLVALTWSFLRTPVYVSEAKVLIQPITLNPSLDQSAPDSKLISPATQQELVQSTAVATRAGQLMGSSLTPQQLLKRVSAKVLPDTTILVVSYSGNSPAQAQAGAAAFANAYLDFREEQTAKALADLSTSTARRIERLKQQLAQTDATINNPLTSPSARQDAQLRRSILVSNLQVLSQRLSSLGAVDATLGQTVEAARLPQAPTSPKHAFDAMVGLVLGLVIGVGVAILRERSEDRLTGREQLGRLLERPVLATVPTVKSWRRREDAFLVTASEPDNPAAEAYRALATKLIVLGSKNDVRTVAVTSPSAGEGKSSTAANLAMELAGSDRRVLLVSADLRQPRLHEFFGCANEVGLSSLLSHELLEFDGDGLDDPNFHSYLWGVHNNLNVLPSGPAVAQSQSLKLLDSEAMRDLLKVQRDSFDFVLLDCPPILHVADTLVLASSVDAVLFVADARETTEMAVIAAQDQVEQVGGVILGAVLNRLEPRQRADYRSARRKRWRILARSPRGRPS